MKYKLKTWLTYMMVMFFSINFVNAQNKTLVNDSTLMLKDSLQQMMSTISGSIYGDYLPSSPKVSSIMKYGEYPVSLYTGLVDITIPVYNIKVNDIEVPVEFKYHASGIRYDDLSLEVGLGWSLIAGGVIEFQARGSRDIYHTPFIKNADNINTYGDCYNNDLRALRGIGQGNKFYIDSNFTDEIRDGETDIYSFHFLQYSGQFFNPYIENTGMQLGYYIFSPANPLQAFGNGTGLYPFIITDDKGISYEFGFTELNNFQPPRMRESYYLTKIISADKADTVTFNYTSPYTQINRPRINSTVTIKETYHFNPPNSSYDNPLTSVSYAPDVYYPGRLNSITFRGGRIEFGYLNNSATSLDLRNVKVYNNTSSTPLQTINLEKSQFNGNRGERLDKITFQNTQSDTYNYQFGYNGNPVANPGSVDYWGYNNGSSVSNGFNQVPNFTVWILGSIQHTLSTANRNANETWMQYGILNKITYPTKGYTEFTYEAHKANNKTYGGLRIKEIRNYESNGTLAERKWYQYGSAGEGRAAAYPLLEDFQTTTSIIEQYDDNGSINFRVHKYRQFSSFPKKSYFISGSSVVYPEVTEFVGNASTDIGKTIYRFEDFANESVTGSTFNPGSPDMPLRTYGWKTGKLKSKTIYKKENSVYTDIYSLTNTYTDKNTSEYMNLRVIPYISSVISENGYGDENIYYCYDLTNYSVYKAAFGDTPFNYFNYYLNTGLRVLETSIEKADGVIKNINYTHNSSGYPTEIITMLSSNKTQKINYKYPADMPGNSIYATMSNRSAVIETCEYVNNSLTTFHRTQYGKNLSTNVYLTAPISEDYQYGGQNSPETRITYNKYDLRGNILHITKDNAEHVFYVWSYNQRYPIAEIKTGVYAYTDVENAVKSVFTVIKVDDLSAMKTPNEKKLKDGSLQSALPNALVTTYTYKPLVGMTSETDPSGRTIYYEYDAFGRLSQIKDDEKKIIKEFKYNYAQ